MSRAHLIADYETWRIKHPEVYRMFEHFAKQIRNAGHTHYSAAQIVGRIRYELALGGDNWQLKINQNFAKYLGDELMSRDTTFAGFFRTRGPNR